MQGIFILGDHLGEAGDVGLGGIHLGLGAEEVEFRDEAELIAALDEVVGTLLSQQSGVGDFKAFAIGGEEQVSISHGGDQDNLGAAAGVFGGEVFLEGAVLEAADAAEEIDFPGGDTEIDTVLAKGFAVPGTGKVSGDALFDTGADSIDGGQEGGTLNPVEGPGAFDIQSSDAEVEVVR